MIYHSVENEQWLLAALLSKNSAIYEIDLDAEDFFYPAHAEIFNQMKALIAAKGDFAYVDLAAWAAGRTFSEQNDGMEYIRDLYDAVQGRDTETIKGYAKTLKELARKRLIEFAAREVTLLLQEKTAQEASDFLQSALSKTTKQEFRTAQEVRRDVLNTLSLPANCVSTGFERLDKAMGGGMYQGFTYGFCGAEKMGKTTLAHSVSSNLNVPHLYIAMEMGAASIEQRNMAKDIGVNSLAFLKRSEDFMGKIKTAGQGGQAIYYDAPGATLDEIVSAVGGAVAKYGIKGFILDYWQLVEGQQRGESEEKHLRRVAQTLADYARKKGLFFLVLAQRNQDGKLFGGNGLRKACDQLYMIEETLNGERWLKMDASRYTFRCDIGEPENPAYRIDTKSGPCLVEM